MLAWLKLQWFCHNADSEIGGFAISSKNDPLYISEFQTVKQETTWSSIKFDDEALADYVEDMLDEGVEPHRSLRIWLHTHPGESVDPSTTDFDTFNNIFGNFDWAVMFILGQTGKTYARLSHTAGPVVHNMIPVEIDWKSTVEDMQYVNVEAWKREFEQNIHKQVWHYANTNYQGSSNYRGFDLGNRNGHLFDPDDTLLVPHADGSWGPPSKKQEKELKKNSAEPTRANNTLRNDGTIMDNAILEAVEAEWRDNLQLSGMSAQEIDDYIRENEPTIINEARYEAQKAEYLKECEREIQREKDLNDAFDYIMLK